MGNFKPFSQNDRSFIHQLNLALNFFSPMYEKFILLGYFNMSTTNPNGKNYMRSFDLNNLIWIDLNKFYIHWFNKKNHFITSATFETGLSDHHKIKTSILRKTVNKSNSRTFCTKITKDLIKRNLTLNLNSE